MDLTDEQWKVVETILPADRVRANRRGRPWSDRRTVLNGVLWILRTGAWLFNFRRLVVRYEYHAENFQGLVHLAAACTMRVVSLAHRGFDFNYLWNTSVHGHCCEGQETSRSKVCGLSNKPIPDSLFLLRRQ